MESIRPFGSCPPSHARGSGTWLHTINWIGKAIRKFQQYAMYQGITTKCCPCNKTFVFANSEVGTCFEICIVNFPTTPPCSTRVVVIETGDVPILFSPPQMKILGITLELNQTRDKTTCPAFGLYSSPVEYSTMGHIVLDLTGLAYQPKSRERSARPTNHVTYALSQRKSARAQEMDDDEDDKPFVHSDRTTGSEKGDEDNKPLVQPSSGKKS